MFVLCCWFLLSTSSSGGRTLYTLACLSTRATPPPCRQLRRHRLESFKIHILITNVEFEFSFSSRNYYVCMYLRDRPPTPPHADPESCAPSNPPSYPHVAATCLACTACARHWRNTVGNLIDICLVRKKPIMGLNLLVYRICVRSRGVLRGTVSSNSRFQAALFQQHSANLSLCARIYIIILCYVILYYNILYYTMCYDIYIYIYIYISFFIYIYIYIYIYIHVTSLSLYIYIYT